jgi:hypothetical protein
MATANRFWLEMEFKAVSDIPGAVSHPANTKMG